ncbi:MAG: hypothetical protein U5N85_02300 [Arcicella sp.]|nr:hypothetical protein [Arcicella sp.]
MKKNIYKYLIVNVLLVFLLSSCSKNTDIPVPQVCYLSTITDDKGAILERFTYDANNRLVNNVVGESDLVYSFTYNAQNQVDKITITDKTDKKTLTFIVTFTYNANNQATKAVTTVNGGVYQTNTFTYINNQLSEIITDDQILLLKTRFEYSGENITKVYQKFDAEKEYLYYESTKFDDKKNAFPEAYKAVAMGLTGLLDGSLYLNKNNIVAEKYYGDDGFVYYTADMTYEYSTTGQPTKITSTIDEDGDKSTTVSSYQYNCK